MKPRRFLSRLMRARREGPRFVLICDDTGNYHIHEISKLKNLKEAIIDKQIILFEARSVPQTFNMDKIEKAYIASEII